MAVALSPCSKYHFSMGEYRKILLICITHRSFLVVPQIVFHPVLVGYSCMWLGIDLSSTSATNNEQNLLNLSISSSAT